MNDKELIKIVKEIGSDVTLLGEFLSKLCIFISVDNGVDKFNLEFDTNKVNNKEYTGILKFELSKEKE